MNEYDLTQAIGNTPLVELTNINSNSAVKIYAKLEGSNPGGSVKDRPAWYMIKKAIESGELTKDKTILEPTSGNTGIALAMIGASLGYKVTLVMPPCVSVERRSVLEAHGAQVILSAPGQATDGAIRLAYQIAAESPHLYFMPNQYANPPGSGLRFNELIYSLVTNCVSVIVPSKNSTQSMKVCATTFSVLVFNSFAQ